MKYSELMELYKEGKLEGKEKEAIENDIAKHEAISEYLFENEDIGSMDELLSGISESSDNESKTNDADADKKAEEDAQEFTKKVKRTIRKMMIKAGIVVGIIVLVLVLALQSFIPHIADLFFYDPYGGMDSEDHLEKDISVYSMMFMPDKDWYNFRYFSKGYGDYDIEVTQLKTDGITGHEIVKEAKGTIIKGEISMDDSNLLQRRESYPFLPALAGVFNDNTKTATEEKHDSELLKGSEDFGAVKEKELESLNRLNYYNAYITFDKPMTMQEVNELNKKMFAELTAEKSWWAVCRKTDGNKYESSITLGFNGNNQYHITALYHEEISENDNWIDYSADTSMRCFSKEGIENMNKKFPKALRYMSGRGDFLKKVNPDYWNAIYDGYEEGVSEGKYLAAFADDIEKNGIYIYGCMLSTVSGADLQTLSQLEDVVYVHTELAGQ